MTSLLAREAREPLAAALAVFARLGAAPWAARTRRELASTGIRRVHSSPLGSERFTCQEAGVALLVARGRSNKEVARELDLKVRTVESHLARAFAKAKVRSRTELAVMLTDGTPPGCFRPPGLSSFSEPIELIRLLLWRPGAVALTRWEFGNKVDGSGIGYARAGGTIPFRH